MANRETEDNETLNCNTDNEKGLEKNICERIDAWCPNEHECDSEWEIIDGNFEIWLGNKRSSDNKQSVVRSEGEEESMCYLSLEDMFKNWPIASLFLEN